MLWMSRVVALAAVTAVAAVGLGLTACGSTELPEGEAAAAALDERPDDAKAAADRARCAFKRGAMPAATLGQTSPVGEKIPIDTVIVLMQENRSFDSYFSKLGEYAHRSDIEVAPDGATNPDRIGSDGGELHPFQHAPHLCFTDTNHEWKESHLQVNGGRMDGFFQTNEGYSELSWVPESLRSGERALYYYDQRDIPFYYELAKTFGIGDHYHSSVIGPTYPNRMFLYSATSFGLTYNKIAYPPRRVDDRTPTMIFDELTDKGVTWNIYKDGTFPGVAVVNGLGAFDRWGWGRVKKMDEFFKDAKRGSLPQVVFVDGHLGNAGITHNDEHPPADVQIGQRWVAEVVTSVMASPQWPHTAFFLTYDENGGIYDHVPPPVACTPDDLEQRVEHRADRSLGGFDRLGMRVPVIVVSPYAKPAYVSHVTYDHTSITRFIEARFELPALTRRDANADPMFDFFDFDHPAFLTPPQFTLPEVDETELRYCKKTYKRPPPPENSGRHGGGR